MFALKRYRMFAIFNCNIRGIIMTIADKVRARIKRSKRYVFERADFSDIAGYDQVGRELRKLVKDGLLMRIGYGIYTQARINSLTGKIMPASPAGADGVILEAIEKLGVEYKFDEFSEQSINGSSLQIPASFQIITSNRFKRKIVVSNRAVNAG
jgi:hypothetical protein